MLLVVGGGRLLFAGRRRDLRTSEGEGTTFVVQVGADHEALTDALRREGWVLEVCVESPGRVRFEGTWPATAEAAIVPILERLWLPLQLVQPQEPTLEDVVAGFLQ